MRFPISSPPAVAGAAHANPCGASVPSVQFRDQVASAMPKRDTGRPDLPVIGPDDSPRRVARRLV
jgi:hypothetical protein